MHWSWEKTRLMAHAHILKNFSLLSPASKRNEGVMLALFVHTYLLTYVVLFSNDCSSLKNTGSWEPPTSFSPPSDTKGLQLLGSFFLAMSFWHHLSKQDWNSLFLAQLGPDSSGHRPFFWGEDHFTNQNKVVSIHLRVCLDPQKRRFANRIY